MSNIIPVSQQQIEEMSKRIIHIERMLGQLVEKIEDMTMHEEAAKGFKETYVYEEGEPEYGTDAWWEWSDAQAMEDIKQGRYTTMKTKEELQTFLDSLK